MTRRQQIWVEEWRKQEQPVGSLTRNEFIVCTELIEWLASPEGVKFLNAAEERCEKEGA